MSEHSRRDAPNGGLDRRSYLQLAGATTIGLLAGCGGSEPDETVAVGPDGDATFEPQTLDLTEEESVEFVWESDGHTIVWDQIPDAATEVDDWEGIPDPQDEGHTYEQEFLLAGTYEYSCDQHEGMEGTIEVSSE